METTSADKLTVSMIKIERRNFHILGIIELCVITAKYQQQVYIRTLMEMPARQLPSQGIEGFLLASTIS
jgi:hypothetical protein